MAKFTITGPDGTKYPVEAASEDEAIDLLAEQLGAAPGSAGLNAFRDSRKKAKSKVSYTEDVRRAIPSGLKKGGEAVIGGGKDTGIMAGGLAARLAKFLGADEQTINAIKETGREAFTGLPGSLAYGIKKIGGPDWTHTVSPTSDEVKSFVDENVPGAESINYAPQTDIGKLVHSGMEFVPAALTGGGPRQITRNAIEQFAAGVASEGAGQWTAGSDFEPWARFAGGAAPSVLTSSSLTRKGSITAPARRTMDRGVDLTAGQAIDSPLLRDIEAAAGGGRFKRRMSAQNEQLGSAAIHELGAPAGMLATPENMLAQRGRITGELDAVEAAVGDVPVTGQHQQDLMDAVEFYRENVPVATEAIQNTVTGIGRMMRANGGAHLTGPQLAELRTGLRKRMDGATGRELEAYQAIQEQLDLATDTHLAATNPELSGRWATARQQYKQYLELQKAVANAPTEMLGTGGITPTGLKGGIEGVEGERRLVEGTTQYNQMAEDAAQTMTKTPSSGTSERAKVIAAATAAATGHPLVAAAGLLGPAGLGAMLMSRPVQNQLMRTPDNIRTMLSLLIANQQSRKREKR